MKLIGSLNRTKINKYIKIGKFCLAELHSCTAHGH